MSKKAFFSSRKAVKEEREIDKGLTFGGTVRRDEGTEGWRYYPAGEKLCMLLLHFFPLPPP